jgi:alpha-glucosidase (family GH31 glycosyl hydrolase)
MEQTSSPARAEAIRTAYGPVEVTAEAQRVFRVRLFGPPEAPDATYVAGPGVPNAAPADAAGSGAPGARRHSDGSVEVATAHGAVRVHPDPLTIVFLDAAGRPLIPAGSGASATQEDVRDASRPAEARRRLRLTLPRPTSEETHCYGLGQGGGGLLERLGTSRMLWNSHHGHGPGTDLAVPLLVCVGRERAFGLFFDTTAAARLDVQRSDRGSLLAYEADTPSLDLYLLAGPTPADVLGAYADLTGHPPLPPRWALGYVQSTRHWDDTDEIRAFARTMRERRIPCDALVFLSTYGEAKSWNVGVGHLEFQPDLWPDPPGLMRELQQDLGYRVVTHEYPVLHPEAEPFAEAEGRGFLLPPTRPVPPRPGLAGAADAPRSLTPVPPPNPSGRRPSQRFDEGQRTIDFSLPAAREWWWDEHRRLVRLGVAGWWLDGAEGPPAAAVLAGGAGRLLHNAYAGLRIRAFAEGEARDRPDGRPWMLCRSGGAGMQRYGAATWSGDINTTFATFEAQVPLGLNTAMSGVPYWGTDIGGFFPAGLTAEPVGPGGAAPSGADASSRSPAGTPLSLFGELYARWFQFGALCPLFRSHGWVWRQHVPWAHGPEVEAICRRYAELRMTLLPYLYTLAWQAHAAGEPLMRPLAYHYPADPNAWELGNEYLLGPDLLVAPVTRPGAAHWPVYLPEGDWYDFWTHQRHPGGKGVSAVAPLDTIPLFVRRGAILPTGPVLQRTDERPLDALTLLVYPPLPAPGGGTVSAEAVLYEDDGASQGYRRGERALTALHCRAAGDAVTVEVGSAEGRYAGQPARRDLTLRLPLEAPPTEVAVAFDGGPPDPVPRVDPAAGAGSGTPGWWREAPSLVWVRLPAVPIERAVAVTLSGNS